MATTLCSLPEYRRIVSALPRPSPEQVGNFVQFVSDAHSWYKHLPLLPPGEPFIFFLDPLSGCDTVHRPGVGAVRQERTETSFRFHYTWMTTREYRARFGHLSYSANAGTRFLVPVSGAVNDYDHLPEFATAEATYHLPPEVAESGSVELTGVISPLAPRVCVWTLILARQAADFPADPPRRWPAETGGDQTLRKILGVCGWDERHREFDRDACIKINNETEAELKTLLEPEKKRLQANMTQAINRMLDLLYRQVPPPEN